MTDVNYNIEELVSNFNIFETWLEKYEFLIDLGKTLPEFPEENKQDENLVKGCQSQVWLIHKLENNKLYFQAYSDSAIVNGLIYLLLTAYNNRTPGEILETGSVFINQIGLDKHLSPTRKNGLHSMLQYINHIANKYK